MITLIIWFCFLFELIPPALFYGKSSPSDYRGITAIVIIILGFYSIGSLKSKYRSISALLLLCGLFCLFYSIVGVLSGSSITSVLWGVKLLIQYPLVALIVFNNPNIFEKIRVNIKGFLFSLLVIEIMIQLYQYHILNEQWDNIAGTFGESGTAKLNSFLVFVLCFFTSLTLYRSGKKSYGLLLLVAVLCFFSSILGEIKAFYVIGPIIMVVGITILAIDNKKIGKKGAIGLIVVAVAIMIMYPIVYSAIYGENIDLYYDDLLTPNSVITYSGRFARNADGTLDVGRAVALSIAMDDLFINPIAIILGYGIGARSESNWLMASGVLIRNSLLESNTGSSIVVFLSEFGLLGILILTIAWLATIRYLYKTRRLQNENSVLNYTLLIYTIVMIILLFYSNAWIHSIAMMLYWGLLGFVVRRNVQLQNRAGIQAGSYNMSKCLSQSSNLAR